MSDPNPQVDNAADQIDAGVAVPIVLIVLGGPCLLMFLCYILDRILLQVGGTACCFRHTFQACCGRRIAPQNHRVLYEGHVYISQPPSVAEDIDPDDFEGITCSNNVDAVCAVCLENMSGQTSWTLACGHPFHKGCIVGWLAKKRTCPVCRKAQYMHVGPKRPSLVVTEDG